MVTVRLQMGFLCMQLEKASLRKISFPSSDPRRAKVLLRGNYTYLPAPVRCGCFSNSQDALLSRPSPIPETEKEKGLSKL